MGYLDDFLECYIEHIDNYEALIYILSLLPSSYQYHFARKLILYDKYMEDGDLYKGVKPVGCITLTSDKIILENPSLPGDKVTLLELPSIWDI